MATHRHKYKPRPVLFLYEPTESVKCWHISYGTVTPDSWSNTISWFRSVLIFLPSETINDEIYKRFVISIGLYGIGVFVFFEQVIYLRSHFNSLFFEVLDGFQGRILCMVGGKCFCVWRIVNVYCIVFKFCIEITTIAIEVLSIRVLWC